MASMPAQIRSALPPLCHRPENAGSRGAGYTCRVVEVLRRDARGRKLALPHVPQAAAAGNTPERVRGYKDVLYPLGHLHHRLQREHPE